MPNVDKELHNPEVTAGNLIDERTTSTAKRSLRGATGGSHIGPILSNAAGGDGEDGTRVVHDHATGIAAGGVKNSTGYRKSAAYVRGTATDSTTRTIRPNPGDQTARGTYRANGVFGGSVPGKPAQRVGQLGAAGAGTGGLTAEGGAAAFIDKRSNIHGSGSDALGSAGRGTRVLNAAVDTLLSPAGVGMPRMSARPLTQAGANPVAGTVSITEAAGAVHGDTNADDITNGANGIAGYVVYIFARDTDTDEDLALVRKGDFDTVTAGAITGISGLAAATYSAYAAFKDAAGNIGPWSARTTVVVS